MTAFSSSTTARTIAELRQRLRSTVDLSSQASETLAIAPPEIRCQPGAITEWLIAAPGSGAATLAACLSRRSLGKASVYAIVDVAHEFYAAAFVGWGIDPSQLLLVRPENRKDAWWAVEQCLRCPAVAATWVSTDTIDERTLRRWQLAAEAGGGMGIIFRPLKARHEPAWADLRIAVTPEVGTPGESRRVRVETLYCRGRLGRQAQVWEIDHAAGHVHVVPSVADSTPARHAAGA